MQMNGWQRNDENNEKNLSSRQGQTEKKPLRKKAKLQNIK